jgi:hypothetical protein
MCSLTETALVDLDILADDTGPERTWSASDVILQVPAQSPGDEIEDHNMVQG